MAHDAAVASRDVRYGATRRVTLVGAVANLLLAVAKLVYGVIGHSQALVADGIHSLSDLLSDVLVIVAARQASQEADAEHPYGHGRFETAATVALGAILMAVAAGLAWEAVARLLEPAALLQPLPVVLVVAFASIVAKEGLYQYTMWVARRHRSDLLKANAWHHRSDAISSVVVLAGVGGTLAGMPYLDGVAAVAVALMVAKVGWDLALSGVQELVDTALEPELVAAIREKILAVDGVRDLHLLKSRRMAGEALVDVHILLEDPFLSVSEGHHISETVRGRLIRDFDDITEVMVHIDPEDDEEIPVNRHLPLRRELLARLRRRWQGMEGAHHVRRIGLHYLNGRVHLDIYLALDALATAAERRRLTGPLVAAAREDPAVGKVRLIYLDAPK